MLIPGVIDVALLRDVHIAGEQGLRARFLMAHYLAQCAGQFVSAVEDLEPVCLQYRRRECAAGIIEPATMCLIHTDQVPGFHRPEVLLTAYVYDFMSGWYAKGIWYGVM